MRPSIDNVDDVIRQSQGKDSNFYDTLFRMMEIQKYQDELLPINERVGIGGRIEIMVLENGSYTLFNYKKFDDYDSLYESVLENCQIQ
ncbi:hypothetical protein SDC9_193791 [bioreactor metagenome]|uniref:Uncharacterized protein n=1 Tax=bioreactor metagenome TaxID=1076179 RepID=A0A645I4M2_9ZZZZ